MGGRDRVPGLAAPVPGRPARVGVIDYGAGNLVSIGQGLEAVGAEITVVDRGRPLDVFDGLVVPGVGAARPAMNRLRRRGLLDPVLDWLAADRPYLGICLGLQLLFEGSDEDGAVTFGVLPGRTRLLADAPRLPHIGWNQVEQRQIHPLFAGIAQAANFYFVHSYSGEVADTDTSDLVLAETTYGRSFASAVARHNVAGVQFHPERSGVDGLRLLANFVDSLAAVDDRNAELRSPPARGSARPAEIPAVAIAVGGRA
jgi:imidazole glycerol phosphate synthase glutamine amidotransferase subunit